MAAILYPQISNNSFQFFHLFDFYFRRLKRVAPALLFLCLFLFVFSHYFLIKSDLISLFREISYSLLFSYNTKFSGKIDYFADTHIHNWLLHTWTLGIEFQFYLVLPIIFLILTWIARTRIRAVILFSCIVLTSFIFMLWQNNHEHNKAFFLLPYRFWEFAAGSLLFILQYDYLENYKLNKLLTYLGWGMLFLCFFFLKENNSYPDIRTLIPIIATVIILFNSDNTLFTNNILA